jgi:hypothetical protein
VVGKQHEIKGESVFAYVVLKGERPSGAKAEEFAKVLRAHVSEQLGAIARPDDIRFADNLPKTRSGKIMRRLLRAIARNEDITQDLSTLENPAIIDQLRGGETATPASAAAPVKKATKKAPAGKAPARKAALEPKTRTKAKPKTKSKTKTKTKTKTRATAAAKKVPAGKRVGSVAKKAGKGVTRKRSAPRRKK